MKSTHVFLAALFQQLPSTASLTVQYNATWISGSSVPNRSVANGPTPVMFSTADTYWPGARADSCAAYRSADGMSGRLYVYGGFLMSVGKLRVKLC